jgi:predicted dehydrogenase
MASGVRVALLGYGLAGRFFHAPFVAATPGLELAAVVTSNEERRAQALDDHPGVAVFDSPDEIGARAEELDLVVVATPNMTHVPLALGALDAGLPVVVDKPLAPTSGEARELVEATRERGLMLTVFQNRRWDGNFLTVRRLVAEGALGTVHRLESRTDRWRPELPGTWREQADEAGGLLLDLGSHLVDQALQLFGPADVVHAELDRRRPGAAVEDDVFIALEHESGTRSHLWMSAVAAQPGPRFRVLGSRAAFVKEGEDVQEAALRMGRRPDEPGWGVEPEERWGRLGVEGEVRLVPTEPGNYGAFYAGVAASLQEGSPPPVDPADAVRALELLDAARETSRSLTA